MHLGDDRGGRDRPHPGVAADHGAHRHAELGPLVAVDQDDAAAAALRPSTARRIASSAARRMLSRSISSTLASAMLQQTARRRISRSSRSRSSGCSSFESLRPRIVALSSQDHGGGDHRPGERPAADLVDPGHRPADVDDQAQLVGAEEGLGVHPRHAPGRPRSPRWRAGPCRGAARGAPPRSGPAGPRRRPGRRATSRPRRRSSPGWRRAAAAPARRSRAAGCWAARSRAGSACACPSARRWRASRRRRPSAA